MRAFKFGLLASLLMALVGVSASAMQAVSEKPDAVCEKVPLKKPLQVYVDPALYASNPRLMQIDPVSGLATSHLQDPRLSLFSGNFYMKRMTDPELYRGFRTVSRVYDLDDVARPLHRPNKKRPRKPASTSQLQDWAVRIQICGDDAYAGTVGLVFLQDLQEATKDPQQKEGLPPSVNSIPNLDDYPSSNGHL